MPKKHPNTRREGGPGSSHQNRKHPEKSKPQAKHRSLLTPNKFSSVSGGGGEPDRHHSHDPRGKAGM